MRQSGKDGPRIKKHKEERFWNMYLNVGLEDMV